MKNSDNLIKQKLTGNSIKTPYMVRSNEFITSYYTVYGKSGGACGVVSKARKGWLISMQGRPLEVSEKFKGAKKYALEQAANY